MWRKISVGLLLGVFAVGFGPIAVKAAPETQKSAGSQVVLPAIPHSLDLVDQNGAMRNLANLAPNKGVVLIFTRSLHW